MSREIFQQFLGKIKTEFDFKLQYKIKVKSKEEASVPISFFLDLLGSQNLRIETVHSMKGSTLDGIMLVGKFDPLTNTSDVSEWLRPPKADGLCEEPRRIAYVAMTRPRRLLVVSIPRECGKALIGHSDWKKSGFEYMDIEDVLQSKD